MNVTGAAHRTVSDERTVPPNPVKRRLPPGWPSAMTKAATQARATNSSSWATTRTTVDATSRHKRHNGPGYVKGPAPLAPSAPHRYGMFRSAAAAFTPVIPGTKCPTAPPGRDRGQADPQHRRLRHPPARQGRRASTPTTGCSLATPTPSRGRSPGPRLHRPPKRAPAVHGRPRPVHRLGRRPRGTGQPPLNASSGGCRAAVMCFVTEPVVQGTCNSRKRCCDCGSGPRHRSPTSPR